MDLERVNLQNSNRVSVSQFSVEACGSLMQNCLCSSYLLGSHVTDRGQWH